MPDRKVWFGTGLGAWNGADVASAAESARLVAQADLDGLDLFTVADHMTTAMLDFGASAFV